MTTMAQNLVRDRIDGIRTRGLAITLHTVKSMVHTWKFVIVLLIAALPALVAAYWAYASDHNGAYDAFHTYSVLIGLQFSVLFISVLYAPALIEEEFTRKTASYWLTRRVHKDEVYLYKYIGFIITSFVVVAVPLMISYSIFGSVGGNPLSAEHLVFLGTYLLVSFLGLMAYGALFQFIGTLTKYSTVVCLLFAFIWETLIANLPGRLPKASIMYYLRTAAANLCTNPVLSTQVYDIGGWQSIIVVIGIVVATLALGWWVLKYKELE
jgi:ABC-type transport system involved in multi-copper enzyme maturation permease subunit